MDQPHLTPVNIAAHEMPDWPSSCERQSCCPYDIKRVIKNTLPDFRALETSHVKTLCLITDTRPLETISHIRPTSAMFYRLGPGSGFEEPAK